MKYVDYDPYPGAVVGSWSAHGGRNQLFAIVPLTDGKQKNSW